MAEEKKPATSTVAEMKVVRGFFSATCPNCNERAVTFFLVTCCRNDQGHCRVVGKCSLCDKERTHHDMSSSAIRGRQDQCAKCAKTHVPEQKRKSLLARLFGR